VIQDLVDQIQDRFAELERQMSDPEVIADRERYAEVGREYRELQPAHALTSRAPASCSPRTATTPS
jgi:peptide chain release factor 1